MNILKMLFTEYTRLTKEQEPWKVLNIHKGTYTNRDMKDSICKYLDIYPHENTKKVCDKVYQLLWNTNEKILDDELDSLDDILSDISPDPFDDTLDELDVGHRESNKPKLPEPVMGQPPYNDKGRCGDNEWKLFQPLMLEIVKDVEFQKKIDRFYVDAYIPELKMVIEYDEPYHDNNDQPEKDMERSRIISEDSEVELFYRIKETDVLENIEQVKRELQERISLAELELL